MMERKPLVSLGDLAWDVLAKPDTMLLPGGDTTGRMELSGGGSAANLAVWARRAGYPATFVGKIGRDRFGELATAELHAEDVRTALTLSDVHPTGVILALIDRRGQRAMLTGQGADWELLPEEVPQEVLREARHLHLTAWSLFRDPPRAAALTAARLAKEAGATLSLDPGSFQMIQQMGRENFLKIVDGVPFDLIFPNADEARAMSGEDDPGRALDWLRARYPHALVVLKLDEEGALLEGPAQPRTHVPASQDRLIDATGAGDAFGGAFLAGWLAHGDAVRAARLAVQVGGWVVSRFGARPPADADLEARLAPFRTEGVGA
ncbi:sugar kinase [Deinococcus metallilatus]|uniref:Sugar kinase n=1 Tax=Deinococcus metallilatus TaxID=1211322 RepID=A0AAJ5F4L4_9DEIO|nr:sugar kinase [Deinococcus metallilatus]MBB5295584.1 sugar/nucleoside kinase (ribokinase family) [Deinococcus metallilatus]QBY07906.1 sugar kinase [Deinococcus metallilatus]RXJ12799.1 sugar kinase [Deinococcus metallilatus]TLK27279.1 sugar kinase [Deinococcus metallilatus]